ncbi:hypothetical protein [Parerythrobacter aestuarii]|uniref:hypothetical protein n=1 Tax=Parerythrobacter aestuarii TaxID=3020909 RepID=UPI0024DEC619|nr:hypothetical protein [Parerythrobacter aestuarii]
MTESKIKLAAILSLAFVALVAGLAYSGVASDKQLQVLVITLPALIWATIQPRKVCRLAGKRDAA